MLKKVIPKGVVKLFENFLYKGAEKVEMTKTEEEALRLDCFGEGKRRHASVSTVRDSDRSDDNVSRITSYKTMSLDSRVSVNIQNGNHWIELPRSLDPRRFKKLLKNKIARYQRCDKYAS